MNEILNNFLFLLTLLLVTQQIFELYTKKLRKNFISIYCLLAGIISIFFCMTFPFPVNEGVVVDLRIVTFFIASMYGGPIVSFGLFLFIVFYRSIIGIDGFFWGAVLIDLFIPIVTYFFHDYFIKSQIKQKLIFSISIPFVHLVFAYFIFHIILNAQTPLNLVLLGGVIKFVCIVLIILTLERIKLNYEIRRKLIDMEKMEMISHLSASIAHEVRNGLTGAKGFIQLLKESEIDPQRKRYADIALEELRRTEYIIRDFLTFAKPAPEKVEEVYVEELINQSIELIVPLANMNNIVVNQNLTSFTITGEKRMLQQAILNMLKNAIESMPSGGVLSISSTSHEENHEIIIEDTGVGMDKEQLDRLGKPYFTTKGQKGTGLGLMVAYRVIEGLNGNVSVASEPGKGTIFTINLSNSIPSSEKLVTSNSFQYNIDN